MAAPILRLEAKTSQYDWKLWQFQSTITCCDVIYLEKKYNIFSKFDIFLCTLLFLENIFLNIWQLWCRFVLETYHLMHLEFSINFHEVNKGLIHFIIWSKGHFGEMAANKMGWKSYNISKFLNWPSSVSWIILSFWRFVSRENETETFWSSSSSWIIKNQFSRLQSLIINNQ